MDPHPTVGRIVHYFESPTSAPLAAIVASIDLLDTVDLVVFDKAWRPHGTHVVQKVARRLPRVKQAQCWDWPPTV